jgi:tetratricopeptide (TPR) repeat protein
MQLPAGSRLEEQIWTASRGNPFMIVETLRALGRGSLPADTSPLPLPERVRDLIAHRLERLGDRSRRLLAVAAVVGRPFDFALLHRATDLGEAEVAEGVEELVRHRVLHGSGESLELTHDRIREVVYGQLVPARRALLHRRVAEALEALHAGALEPHALALGTHYWEGEAWALAVVYLWTRRHDEAIKEAERAISLDQNFSSGHMSLGLALHYSGKSEAALECFDRGIALDPFYPDVYMHFQAQSYFQLTRYEEAAEILKRRIVRDRLGVEQWPQGPFAA